MQLDQTGERTSEEESMSSEYSEKKEYRSHFNI